MNSQRPDGRGHWPAGKYRHQDRVRWTRVRQRLARVLKKYPDPGRVSCRALAAEIGVSDRTVRRWLDGTDRPDPKYQRAVRDWLRAVVE